MKTRRPSIVLALFSLIGMSAMPQLAHAYLQLSVSTFSAVAVVGQGGGSVGSSTFFIPQLLPIQAFFGKDVAVPIEVWNSVASTPVVTGAFSASLPFGSFSPGSGSGAGGVTFVYQLLDNARNPLGPPASVPIAMQSGNSRFTGTALVPLQNIQGLRRGGILSYYFQIQSGNVQVPIRNAGAPFEVVITNTMSIPVNELGSVALVPDTYIPDGKTSVQFAAGALSNAGTLWIRQLDPINVPAGPGGLSPIVVYEFELEGTSLVRDARVTLSYPARADGSILGSNGNPADLAPYRLRGSEWQVLGPRSWDSRMHTITVTSPDLNRLALFLSAATSPADLRPRRKILTPNGDGVNDTVDFSGIAADGVHLFDLNGRRVRDLSVGNLVWDGRDDEGRVVESGLYLYQYNSQGERVSGVILIAK